MGDALKTTPLTHEHVTLGAKMVPFAGWLMPVQYTSLVAEHQAVRNALGIFDISHMGQFIVSGERAASWLNEMLTNNVARLEVRQGQYTFLLNERGGIIDDLILYRIGDTEFLLVVNAAKIEEDWRWLKAHVRQASNGTPSEERNLETCATLKNRSAEFGAAAIQGPRALGFFRAWIGGDKEPPSRNFIADFPMAGGTISIARTGYTGEDGFEVFFPAEIAGEVWRSALSVGAQFGMKPCGLGARDTLRLEMCYPLNGSDLSPERNPLEAGLGLFVDLSKSRFAGREALLASKANGARERLIAFKMDGKGPPPRPHYAVLNNGERVGEITSGTLSPSLNIGIGMAYVSAEYARPGTPLEVEIRGQKFPATIEKKPLYKKPA
ncbi:MAG: glycine cleavage system aminomethyltransferase GcvT [Verrucomicrobia bacterium]|nr:glycine cleavage system aminomethyltransferase GcvT [Verrucomicrobiota bacterium]